MIKMAMLDLMLLIKPHLGKTYNNICNCADHVLGRPSGYGIHNGPFFQKHQPRYYNWMMEEGQKILLKYREETGVVDNTCGYQWGMAWLCTLDEKKIIFDNKLAELKREREYRRRKK